MALALSVGAEERKSIILRAGKTGRVGKLLSLCRLRALVFFSQREAKKIQEREKKNFKKKKNKKITLFVHVMHWSATVTGTSRAVEEGYFPRRFFSLFFFFYFFFVLTRNSEQRKKKKNYSS